MLNLDDSILAAFLWNYEGRIRSTELRKDKEPWKGIEFDSRELRELTSLLGPRLSIAIGAVEQNAPLFGPLESIIVIYGSCQILLLDVPGAKMNLAVMLQRSCDLDSISLKLRNILR